MDFAKKYVLVKAATSEDSFSDRRLGDTNNSVE